MTLSAGPVVLNEAEVSALLDLDGVIDSQRQAFTALGDGSGLVAEKAVLDSPDGSTVLSYLGRVSTAHGVVNKVVSVQPDNPARGLPAITATLVVLHPLTGEVLAVLAGGGLTAVRTAAASAVAIDALTQPTAGDLAILGSGVQGRWHVRALARVRKLRRIRMWSPNQGRCETTAEELSAELDIEVIPVRDAAAAVGDADLVIAGTLSHTPVVPTSEVARGATVVSVGSFAPDRHELDQALLDRADNVVVDHVRTATGHAGPIMRAVADGVLREGDLTSLGEVLCGLRPGRRRPSDVVVYNSVGLGVQDAAAAALVLARHHAAKR
ncbi:ornithine cyclodeaminase family protein [Crossiella cryophila]|uniref:Ornithine cyclodeaminase n=1 Tax=Crossiella cryophila TaxID=43355 RepID=A0A7W7CB33_9PSEU|nr:ornithine cyclodeaminase family protein [Crossiella cryophila]MBB4677892.1 ornithine cyclodeaminase [Crossiella cryophila]